ncbi:unnamed protein product [Tilletia controversa]|nr:unnamed protein product [Tilletia controversa]
MLSPDILGQAIRKEGSVRGYALYALGLITALRDRTVEISLDATFGTNNSGHDLFAVLAEVNGTGVPLLYLLLDTKDMRGDGRRIEMLSEVLAMLKGMGVSPSFVGCDKEAAEIKAIGQVWPDAKVQLCYWHVRRALRQRLGNGKATMTNQYDAYEAAATVPGLDVCWGVAERRRHRTELCTCPSRRTPTADDPNALNLTWDKAARLELPKEQNEALVEFVCRHYNAHPLFPSISGASMTAEQLRVQAATEAYQFCKAKGWARVWAYLWTNWYRSDEWKLWARSASPTIPVLKTTMICESHWRVVKHDYLHNFARPRIDHVAHIIRTRLIPHMVRRLQALLQGQTRMVTPSWKRELVTAWREAEQRDTVSDEAITRYKTCIHTWTCACESFLQSRFLICKHLVQTVNHMSTADIKAMERHREPPFWTHPALSSARPEQPCGQGCGIGVVRDAAGDPSAGEGEEDPNDGADDEGDVDENGDVNRDGVEEDAELEPSVTEKFEEAALMLTRMAKLLEREQPWSSRPFIDAFLRHNRQNFKLLEDDERRLSRQSMALTWGNSRHQASMYLRGDDAV